MGVSLLRSLTALLEVLDEVELASEAIGKLLRQESLLVGALLGFSCLMVVQIKIHSGKFYPLGFRY